MTDAYESVFIDDPEFQSLLVACLESLQRGQTIDRNALATDFPKYADEIGKFLSDRQLLGQVASGLRDVEPSPVATSACEKRIAPKPSTDDFSIGETIRYIGEYEILEEIARGGMGVVFKARQQKLQRIVALKMILAGRLADAVDVERFHREAQAAARLKHPAIVPVHEIGEHGGRHYFTMDFVDGRSLAGAIREETVAPRAAAELVRAAAVAVQYAHEQGTVHRDLKPANILLDANNKPQITDFGLAKILESVDEESRAELTASGQILGTPSYMSPEQAAGKQELVGPASDIYSLGAILYACLTGRAPFVADSPVDTLIQVMEKEPVPPRELNPSVPGDLETICLKCLTKEPHKRYGTAQELADDLNRFLEGRPVVARPVGLISKTTRWCRRNPIVACLLALVAVLMTTGTVVSTYYGVAEHEQRLIADAAKKTADVERGRAENALVEKAAALEREQHLREEAEAERERAELASVRADEQRQIAERASKAEAEQRMQAEAARELAERNELEARRNLYGVRLLQAGDAWQKGELGHLDRILDEMQPSEEGPDLRCWEWSYLRNQARQSIFTLPGEHEYRATAAWSPSGDEFAVLADGRIQIWDTRRREVARTLSHEVQKAIVNTALDWSPDGRRIAYGQTSGVVPILDAKTGETLVELRHPHGGWITGTEFSPDGKQIITSDWKGSAVLWDTESGESIRTLFASEGRASLGGIAWHSDGDRFAMIRRGHIELRKVETGDVVWSHPLGRDLLWSIAWNPSGNRLAVGRDDILVLDAEGTLVQTFRGHQNRVARIAWRDDDHVWSASFDQTVRSWRIGEEDATQTIRLHSAPAYFVSVSPDRKILLTAGLNERIRLLSLDLQPSVAVELPAVTVSPNSLNWSPRRNRLLGTASVLVDGMPSTLTLRVWDADDPSRHWTLKAPDSDKVTVSGWGVDDRSVVFRTASGRDWIWEIETGRITERDGQEPPPNFGGSWRSPDGRYRIKLANRNTVNVVDNTSDVVVNSTAIQFIFNSACWNRAGKAFAIASNKRLWIVDRDTWRSRRSATYSDAEGFAALSWSTDDEVIAAATTGGGIELYTTEPKRFMVLHGHSAPATDVVWSPDGQRLVSSSQDGTVRVWDSATGRELLALRVPNGSPVMKLSWSPDGRHIVTLCRDGNLSVWSGTDRFHASGQPKGSDPGGVLRSIEP